MSEPKSIDQQLEAERQAFIKYQSLTEAKIKKFNRLSTKIINLYIEGDSIAEQINTFIKKLETDIDYDPISYAPLQEAKDTLRHSFKLIHKSITSSHKNLINQQHSKTGEQ